jgi:hypothetical protein
VECISYCDSFCGYDLKINCYIKRTFDQCWFGIYIYLVKAVVEIEVKQKII